MFEFLDVYPWLLPFIIFFGRIIDVTLGTLRIIFVSKGAKNIAPIIGFVEVFIWIVIISQILVRANDIVSYLSYAAGYATGNYVGILIENRIAYGILLCRIYTQKNGKELVQMLNQVNFGATMTHGTGSTNEVDIIETVVDRKEMKTLALMLTQFDSNIFYVVEDVRTKKNGIFPKRKTILSRWRVGK
ncbi:putative protein YebE [Proteiniphilum saccharofermentans]|jgi:uncharacterized protein YebE (UPF0316 family)|uniref:UPF0316 protein PSM36_2808 n=1 Tax=Proteiniphilum saccharofermentans TaxID=1642647 RepID=A0A1R3TDA8_9BACT|nr:MULTISPECIES: DUF5698 domain-containing protein [Proteiniphilum]MDY9918822.1 DUF5698 domain-containing protein [Proteiniphilum sp.]SCD21604.1 putative protein YebE [Proteiniphilum saccharofermentans]SEA47746.1 Uncharacterized protein YebE, UPF0316 family [Porphyromonadaceae bacterium KH3R12]SFK26319.1 Uncharacterized protein YebE, UPF0316 family [Porphyromonadaceae bacterium KH3CP3RA]